MSAKPSFTEGELSGHVLRLSGFMILGFLAMTLAQLIEAAYLGMVGAAELAAIAFAFPVVMAFNAATRGIGIGAGAVLARAIGSGDREAAAVMASHGLLLTLAFTIVCGVLLAVGSRAIFAALGAEGRVHELASMYLDIWAIGFPAFAIGMVGAGLMRSIGDAAFPGYVMTAGSVLQVIFGPPLIFGWGNLPALGIEGAAWAFVLARAASMAMTFWWFARRERILRLSLSGFGASVQRIAHVGVPAGASNLIQPASLAVITWLLAPFGNNVVAGFGVASRIEAVVNMVVIGISASTAPLVGQNWGARLYQRAREVLTVIYRYCHIWGITAAVLMWMGGAWFVSLISDDPQIGDIATMYLWIVPISIGFTGMINVANASFNALSKPMPPLILSLTRLVAVYFPLAWLAGQWYQHTGIFVTTALVNVLFGMLGWWWNARLIDELTPRSVSVARPA